MSRYASGLPWCCDPGLGHTHTHTHTLCKRMHAFNSTLPTSMKKNVSHFFSFLCKFVLWFKLVSWLAHMWNCSCVCLCVCVCVCVCVCELLFHLCYVWAQSTCWCLCVHINFECVHVCVCVWGPVCFVFPLLQHIWESFAGTPEPCPNKDGRMWGMEGRWIRPCVHVCLCLCVCLWFFK